MMTGTVTLHIAFGRVEKNLRRQEPTKPL